MRASPKTTPDPVQPAWRRAVLEHDGWSAAPEDAKTLVVMRGERIAARIKLDHDDDELRCFTFLPHDANGTHPPQLAVGSDYELALYDVRTGTRLRRLVGHLGTVWAVASDPQGRWLASASADQTFRLWSLAESGGEQSPALSFFVTRDDQWVVWTPEGYYKASAGGHERIGWHINQGTDRAARFVNAWQMRRLYERPGIVERVPEAGSVRRAVELYNADPRQRPESVTDIRQELGRQLPPLVTLLEPPSQAVVAGGSVRVRARIEPATGVGRAEAIFVRVTVNQRPVPGWEERRMTPEDAGLIEADAPLVPGENEIAVIARTEAVTSDAAVVSVTCRPAERPRIRPALYVLTIGVSEYRDPNVKDLRYADADARAVAQAFEAQAGRLFGQVHVTTLLDSQATKVEILKAVEALTRQVTQIDLAVVLVSGHGDRDSADRYFFIPHDYEHGQMFATAVRWSDLQDPLSRLPCPVILLMDTCHSAGVTGHDPGRRARMLVQDGLDRAISELAGMEAGLLVLACSLPAQRAVETTAWGHGALALSVLEAIQGQHLYLARKETPLPGDDRGIVQLPDLRDYVVRRVKELTGGTQHAISLPKDLPKIPIATTQASSGVQP